jgi:hypothetical protein
LNSHEFKDLSAIGISLKASLANRVILEEPYVDNWDLQNDGYGSMKNDISKNKGYQ